MSEKAVGHDWKKRIIYTLRHDAGAEKYRSMKKWGTKNSNLKSISSNSKINNVINNSVFVAESYLEEHKETIKGDVYAMYDDLNSSSEIFSMD